MRVAIRRWLQPARRLSEYATRNEFKHCTAAVAVADILRVGGQPAEARAELARSAERQMTIPSYREMLAKARAALAPEQK